MDCTPLTEASFEELKVKLNDITTHMPEAYADFIWNNYNAIRNSTERQPCTCGSAGKMWGEAIGALRAFVKSKID